MESVSKVANAKDVSLCTEHLLGIDTDGLSIRPISRADESSGVLSTEEPVFAPRIDERLTTVQS